jgi:hypothetical protein
MNNIKDKKKTIVRTIILLMCGMIVPISLIAQDMEWGIKGGVNFSNLFVEQADDESARTGFHAGVYSKIPVASNFAIQPELLFSTKGADAEYASGMIDYNLNYIDVPVLADFQLGPTADLLIGPYVGVLLGSTAEVEGSFGDELVELSRDDFAPVDFGFSAGFALNFNALSVGTRYSLGVVQVAQTEVAENILGNSSNSLAQVYLSYRVR